MSHGTDPHTRSPKPVKSPAAFRTISEVARELDVPQHVLRFWETKFPQIRPLKRRGGRRYYRPDDILLLRRIRDLLYQDGYTIRGVQRLLKRNGVRAVIEGDGTAADPTAAGSACGEEEEKGVPSRLRGELEAVLSDLVALRHLLVRAKGR